MKISDEVCGSQWLADRHVLYYAKLTLNHAKMTGFLSHYVSSILRKATMACLEYIRSTSAQFNCEGCG